MENPVKQTGAIGARITNGAEDMERRMSGIEEIKTPVKENVKSK